MDRNMDMSVPCDNEMISDVNFCTLKMENMKQALLKSTSFIQKESSTHIKVETMRHSNSFINHKSLHADDISLHSEFHSQFSSSLTKNTEPGTESLHRIRTEEIMGMNRKLLSNSTNSLHSNLIRGTEVTRPPDNRLLALKPSLNDKESTSLTEDLKSAPTSSLGDSSTETPYCNMTLASKQIPICEQKVTRPNEIDISLSLDKTEGSCDQQKETSTPDSEIDPKILEEIEDFEKLVAQHMKHHKMQ